MFTSDGYNALNSLSGGLKSIFRSYFMDTKRRNKLLKLLKEKRREINAMDNELNTKRKMLNIEIDLILDILGMDEDEVMDGEDE